MGDEPHCSVPDLETVDASLADVRSAASEDPTNHDKRLDMRCTANLLHLLQDAAEVAFAARTLKTMRLRSHTVRSGLCREIITPLHRDVSVLHTCC